MEERIKKKTNETEDNHEISARHLTGPVIRVVIKTAAKELTEVEDSLPEENNIKQRTSE